MTEKACRSNGPPEKPLSLRLVKKSGGWLCGCGQVTNTGFGLVGHMAGKPICDRCLLDYNPTLGMIPYLVRTIFHTEQLKREGCRPEEADDILLSMVEMFYLLLKTEGFEVSQPLEPATGQG